MKKIIVFGLIFIAVLIVGFSVKTKQVTIKNPELELANAPVAVAPIPPLPSIELIPGNEITQGETLRVVFKNPGNASSSFIFKDKKYDFFKYNGEWNALIPFSASAATGTLNLSIGSSTENIAVKPGNFEIVTIVLPKLVNTPQEIARYQAERKKIAQTYASSEPEIYFDKPFNLPFDDISVSTEFAETYFDPSDNSRTFHNGVDLRAKTGTPVKAINDGVVKTAEDYITEGKFIMIDHGFGIFSNYLHLSEINVKAGDKILNGQIIGLSGDSGKSVGPHLHFMVKIGDVPVDPLAFMKIWK